MMSRNNVNKDDKMENSQSSSDIRDRNFQGSSSEYDSDSESEEEEPKLKYERVRGYLPTLLERDSLTTIASNDKVIMLGTFGGGVVVLDHLGYKIQHRRPHVAQVVSVSLVGDYWASAGKDRKVVVYGELSSEQNTKVTLETGAVTCVLLDPAFAQTRATTRFIVGHSAGLNLYERSLFGGYRKSALSESAGAVLGATLGVGGGTVRGAAWRGAVLAWATDSGVRVYHLGLRTTVALLPRDHSAALDCIRYTPCLRWHSDDQLLVGWADSVKICRLKPRPRPQTPSSASRNSSSKPASPSPTLTESSYIKGKNSRSSTPVLASSSRRDSVTSLLALTPEAKGNANSSLVSSSSSFQNNISSPPLNLSSGIPSSFSSSGIFNSSIIGVTGSYSSTCTGEGGYSSVPSLPPPLDLPPLFVEIECMFSTPFYLCGLGLLDGVLLTLTYNKTPSAAESRSSPTDTTGPQNFTQDLYEWRRPQLRLLEPQQRSYEEISKDILGTNGYKDYLPMHYKLECVAGEDRWYVLSPRDLVVARHREPCDTIQWLLQRHKYAQALELLEKEGTPIGSHTEASVGRKYMQHLLEYGQYSEAATVAARVLGEDDVPGWQKLQQDFANAGQVSVLHEHLPIGPPPPLPVIIYETVLHDLLNQDWQGLVAALQRWPSTCYDVEALGSRVLQCVATHNRSVPLLQALAHLYSHQQRHDKALAIYITLQHKDIFGLIKKHRLYKHVCEYVEHLMKLDAEATTELCMKHIDDAPPSAIVPALAGNSPFQYRYLSSLYDQHRDLCRGYHDDLVSLMADNGESDKLLQLLKSSSSYSLTKALTACKTRGLLPHTVYLLERTGNTQDALSLVLLEARDLPWAIRLCTNHNDRHLWDTLIDNTVQHADNIKPLLEEVGPFVGEAEVLRRISPGLHVPGIMETVSQILANTRKKRDLHAGCERLCQRDIVLLARRRRVHATRSIAVDEQLACPHCGKPVCGRDAPVKGGVVAFKCDHVFHASCLVPSTEVPQAEGEDKNEQSVLKKGQSVPHVCSVCQIKNKLFG